MRRRYVHFVVTNLTLSRPWRVGSTTIYPPGYLLDRLDRHLVDLDPPLPQQLADEYRRDLSDRNWSTIRVPVEARGGRVDGPIIDGARDVARDVIAVLRLFQRVRVRYVSLDRQTFGLATDIGSIVEPRWITDAVGRFASVSWERHGVLAPWTFRAADLQAYRTDPRFAYLDEALAAGDHGRDDWQGRAIAAARTMSLATIMERPAMRVILLAAALEALLGDKFTPGAKATGGHRLARRAAYLYCGSDLPVPDLHRPGGRPACRLLTATADPRKDPSVYDREPAVWGCSWYGDMRDLYDARNAALHGAEARFDQRAASTHAFHLDAAVLSTLAWVAEIRPRSIDDLDAAIAALPTA